MLAALGILAAGCGSREPAPPGRAASDKTEAPATPEAQLAEQLRSGSVQLSALLETIQEADAEAAALHAKAKPSEKEALTELRDFLASTADAAAEYAAQPPTEAEVTAAFAKFDEQRLTAITELNDALVDLSSARGTAEALAEADAAYDGLASLLELAGQDLEEGISALGGTVEAPPVDEEPPAEGSPAP